MMAQPTRQLPNAGQNRGEKRSEDKGRSEEDASSNPASSIVVSDEEFEAFQEALRKPQKASPSLRALFASKRKL
jgi:hypothetical protein